MAPTVNAWSLCDFSGGYSRAWALTVVVSLLPRLTEPQDLAKALELIGHRVAETKKRRFTASQFQIFSKACDYAGNTGLFFLSEHEFAENFIARTEITNAAIPVTPWMMVA